MNTYRVARRDGTGACCWLQARDDFDARRLIALNVPGGEGAENIGLFDCQVDQTRKPVLGFISFTSGDQVPIFKL